MFSDTKIKKTAKAERDCKLSDEKGLLLLACEWHDLNKGRWTDHQQSDVLRSLERDAFPSLGKVPIGGIEAHDMLDLLRKIEKRGSIERAKRIRYALRAPLRRPLLTPRSCATTTPRL